LLAHERGEQVEPVDGKIVEDEVVDALERRAADPTVIPVDAAVDGRHLADEPGLHRLADVAEVGRPAGILVHRQENAVLLCQRRQAFAVIEVEHERLLAEDVFFRIQAVGYDRRSNLGMRCDVDNFDVVELQQLAVIGEHLGVGIILVPALLGSRADHVAQCHHAILRGRIRLQVVFGDAAATDQGDSRRIISRIAGQVGQRCQRHARHGEQGLGHS
jgi:hypothetical protein